MSAKILIPQKDFYPADEEEIESLIDNAVRRSGCMSLIAQMMDIESAKNLVFIGEKAIPVIERKMEEHRDDKGYGPWVLGAIMHHIKNKPENWDDILNIVNKMNSKSCDSYEDAVRLIERLKENNQPLPAEIECGRNKFTFKWLFQDRTTIIEIEGNKGQAKHWQKFKNSVPIEIDVSVDSISSV